MINVIFQLNKVFLFHFLFFILHFSFEIHIFVPSKNELVLWHNKKMYLRS